jgi:4-amino-4-deoxy-L-arabinose transferase-like glycosyltransferase
MPDIGLLGGPPRPRAVPARAREKALPPETVEAVAVGHSAADAVAAGFIAPVAAPTVAVVSASVAAHPAGEAPVAVETCAAPAIATLAVARSGAAVAAPVLATDVDVIPTAAMTAASGRDSPAAPQPHAPRLVSVAPPPIRWTDLLWLAFALFVVIGTGLGVRDPWPADEPRFAVVARDMAATGEWLFPRVGGDLYQDKPPFFFWLLAICYMVIGSIRWSFLVPAFCAAGGVLFLVYDFGRRLVGRDAGFACALVLCFTLQFVMVFRGAQIDPVLCFLTTLSVYALLRHLLLGPAWGWYFAGGFAAGVGVFTKGVGFLPLLLLIPFFLLRGFRWRGLAPIDAGKGGWRWWLAPFAMLLAISLWFVPMLMAVAASGSPEYAAYRDEILFKQTVGRYAASWHHVKSWYYFIVEVVPPLWLPFSLLLFWLVPMFKAAFRERDARVWLPLAWVLLVLLFFSWSPGKRGVYITPALPALALASLPFIDGVLARAGVRRAGLILGGLFFTVAAAFLIAYSMQVPFALETLAAANLAGPLPLYVYLALCGAGLLYAAIRAPLAAWPVAIGSLAVVFSYLIAPAMNGERSGKDFVSKVLAQIEPAEALEPRAELGLVAYKEQFLLYIDRPVVNFGHRRVFEGPQESHDASAWLNDAAGRVLLVPASQIKPCFGANVSRVGETSGEDWFLVRAPADSACAKQGDARRAILYYNPTPKGIDSVERIRVK